MSLAELVPKIKKLRLYRGWGGEIMRAAVCRYIECITLVGMTLSVKQQVCEAVCCGMALVYDYDW
ncbi:MAG: hypothetical protein AAGJ35_14785 [Myxococcota bacterium]